MNDAITAELPPTGPQAPFRILSLDGGGAKGFYTIGVLVEVEAMLRRPLCECFDLVYGTSTGAIIASLIALGYSVADIHALYQEHVPSLMSRQLQRTRTRALREAADTIFGDRTFGAFKTRIGLVAADWDTQRPAIFKSDLGQARAGKATFDPGFGVRISEAVQASCSAFPLYCRKSIVTSKGAERELLDGGYCANNPTLYAIAEAVTDLGVQQAGLRVLSVGVGEYPAPGFSLDWTRFWMGVFGKLPSVRLLTRTLEINTKSMDELRLKLFQNVATVRISNKYSEPTMAADLLEHNRRKLNLLWQRGRDSFREHEAMLKTYFE